MLGELNKLADELRAQGRKPYVIPGGGSNPIGALGYVSCAQEILTQTFEKNIKIDHIVTTSGSSGTHAGLLVGMIGNNANIPITGISVNRKKDAQTAAVYHLAQKTAEKLKIANEIKEEDVVVYDNYVGAGYSIPTDAMVEAVELLAKTEGILLDPVYTGKAMSGLVDLIRQGKFQKDENILFIHTGGSPALYAYTQCFNQK